MRQNLIGNLTYIICSEKLFTSIPAQARWCAMRAICETCVSQIHYIEGQVRLVTN